MNKISIRKTLMASSIALALGAPAANAALLTNVSGVGAMSTDSANFTLLTPDGYVIGGTNDYAMYWDGNAFNSSTDYVGPGSAANITASSTSGFFAGWVWEAHDIQVFTPGNYLFDASLGGGNPESGILSMTVGAGQLGMHMLADFGGNFNIDVVLVENFSSVFGSGLGLSAHPGCGYNPYPPSTTHHINCLYDGLNYGNAGMPNASNPWMLASADPDGDGVMGVPMVLGGPFQFFNANFNANMTAVVPVPAAAWLFGSGMLGLLAVARRRKKTV